MNKIGERIGKWLLEKAQKKEEHKGKRKFSLSNARMGAILLEVDSEEMVEAAINLAKYLRDERGFKKVRLLGFCKQKETPDYATGRRDMDVLDPSRLNWKGSSKKGELDTFLGDRYDVAVDLSSGRSLPLDNVLFEIDADLKVGKFKRGREDFYDLMIEAPEEDGPFELTDLVKKYLEMMNLKS